MQGHKRTLKSDWVVLVRPWSIEPRSAMLKSNAPSPSRLSSDCYDRPLVWTWDLRHQQRVREVCLISRREVQKLASWILWNRNSRWVRETDYRTTVLKLWDIKVAWDERRRKFRLILCLQLSFLMSFFENCLHLLKSIQWLSHCCIKSSMIFDFIVRVCKIRYIQIIMCITISFVFNLKFFIYMRIPRMWGKKRKVYMRIWVHVYAVVYQCSKLVSWTIMKN